MGGIRKVLDPTRIGEGAETLGAALGRRIIGQDEAIRQIVNIYQTYLTGMAMPGQPVGSLLFLGPTGSGKTRTVEALAESLAGDPRAVIKIDCGEFQHSHEIAKLVGSPPGYLGHRETHPLLSQDALDQFHTETLKLSFVLFDEIEKANDALWNLLLGVLDKATLTLGDNRRVDFSRAIIFMTSNLGAAEMNAVLRPGLGFADAPAAGRELAEKLARAGTEAARRRFTPEFLNRIDRVVTFQPLGAAELQKILDIELKAVETRVLRATGARAAAFDVTGAARELLLREGTDTRYGARHLKRAVERRLVHPISNLIATGQWQSGDRLLVECDGDRLVFSQEPSEEGAGSAALAAA
jgi:ATP-dependent Clp protease ATP-binding subunit ClpA